MRHVKIEHQQRQRDGEDTVREGFEAGFIGEGFVQAHGH